MYPTPMHEWFEGLWNNGDTSVVERLLAPNVIMHNFDQAGGESTGSTEFIERYHRFRSAFPDLHFTVHHVFEQGGYLACRWTFTGTHQGEGLGLPPTHRKIEIAGMSFGRFEPHFEHRRAVETWDSWDLAGMMQQLGQNHQAREASA